MFFYTTPIKTNNKNNIDNNDSQRTHIAGIVVKFLVLYTLHTDAQTQLNAFLLLKYNNFSDHPMACFELKKL